MFSFSKVRSDRRDISGEILEDNGKLKLLSYKDYDRFSWEEFRLFCHVHSRYGIPTIESIEFIRSIIKDRVAIEIGAGHGDLGYHLGIKSTDSYSHEFPEVKKIYEILKQPPVNYPPDVERLEALEAVHKYKPQVVIASWVTVFSPTETSYGSSPHGVKEEELLNLVDTYILIGNIDSHGGKPIMNKKHDVYEFPFVLSRGSNRKNNRIFVWNKDSLV